MNNCSWMNHGFIRCRVGCGKSSLSFDQLPPTFQAMSSSICFQPIAPITLFVPSDIIPTEPTDRSGHVAPTAVGRIAGWQPAQTDINRPTADPGDHSRLAAGEALPAAEAWLIFSQTLRFADSWKNISNNPQRGSCVMSKEGQRRLGAKPRRLRGGSISGDRPLAGLYRFGPGCTGDHGRLPVGATCPERSVAFRRIMSDGTNRSYGAIGLIAD